MVEKHAIILVRVSTEIQDYEPQINDLLEYANSKGFTKIKQIETKESGLADKKNRLGLDKLIGFINENPEYNTVFATELSRIARRQSVLHDIKEWFVTNNIQLYLKDTGYSLFDESGKVSIAGEIMFTLYGFFAESEVKQKKDRFSRSKKQLMEMGLSISGQTLFGYDKVKTESKRTSLVVNPENADIIRKIYNWYLMGINSEIQNPSIKKIVLECIKQGFPKYTHSKRNVNKLLKEEGYTGFKTTNNKRKNPNFDSERREDKYIITSNKIKYPQIIDNLTFQAVQEKLKINNSKADKSTKHITLLSRLIKCPVCDNHFNGDYRTKEGIIRNTYRCGSRAKATPCNNKQVISMVMLDSVVWSLIKTDLKLLADSINEINPDTTLKSLDKQKKIIQSRIDKIVLESKEIQSAIKNAISLTNLDLSDVIASFESKIIKIDKEKGELEKELNSLNSSLSIQQNKIDDIFDVVSNNIDSIEQSKELLKKYINYFVKSLTILTHNTKFTVLKINFKMVSKTNYIEKSAFRRVIEDNEYEKQTFVIIDKRTTQKIKAIKILRPFEFISENTIKIGALSYSIDNLFSNFNLNNTELKEELKDISLFDIQKLKVY